MKSSIVDYTDAMHSLQVVMNVRNDQKYIMRCLPWFLNKRYLNRYIFDGNGDNIINRNEVFVHNYSYILPEWWQANVREELYELFLKNGIDNTFSWLSKHARSVGDYYTYGYNIRTGQAQWHGIDSIQQRIVDELLQELSVSPHDLSLIEIITAMTYKTLHTMRSIG